MKMGSGKTLWSYKDRYWELYNEIGGGNEQVVSTFKLGLLYEFVQKDSLTMKLPENMQQLIRQKEEHKRLEDNRLQSKRKALAALQY